MYIFIHLKKPRLIDLKIGGRCISWTQINLQNKGKNIIKLVLKKFFMSFNVLTYTKLLVCVGEGSFRIIWITVELVLAVHLIPINVQC